MTSSALGDLVDRVGEAVARGDRDAVIALCLTSMHSIEEASFEDWYAIKNAFALALLFRSSRTRDETELAIQIFSDILARLPEENGRKRMSVLRNLGMALEERESGSPERNFREAISCYQRALADELAPADPLDKGLIEAALGFAWEKLVRSDSRAPGEARIHLTNAVELLGSLGCGQEVEEIRAALGRLSCMDACP